MSPLPEIAPGTILRLARGEWSIGHRRPGDRLLPAEHHTVIRVEKVHTDRVPEDGHGVWVTGHGLECAWPSSECTTPCTHVYVFTAVYVREAAAVPKAGTE